MQVDIATSLPKRERSKPVFGIVGDHKYLYAACEWTSRTFSRTKSLTLTLTNHADLHVICIRNSTNQRFKSKHYLIEVKERKNHKDEKYHKVNFKLRL